MEPRSRTRRLIILGAATVLALSSLTAATPSPAGATTVPTGTSDLLPVTWVDGSHRQHVLMSAGTDGTLQIARDTASGKADATWGTFRNTKGLRQLVVAPPASGATMDRRVAVDHDGTITTTWTADGCAGPTATCDRWFVRVTATGTAVGAPALRSAVAPPLRALADGSIITGAASGPIGWRSPTGVEQGAPALTPATLRSASVDGAGRLLVTSSSGQVTRWPAGGPADLTFASGCTSTEGVAIGAPLADDGFALVCGAPSAGQVVATRYEDDGQVRWTTTGVPVDRATHTPTHVTVDAADRVWVAGLGTVVNGGFPVPIAAIAVVGSAQHPVPATAGYQRWRMGISQYDGDRPGVSDLRPTFGDHVAYADLHNCCQYRWGFVPTDRILGAILPTPATSPAVPTCEPRMVRIIAATRTTATVQFRGCAPGAAGPAPIGYLVEDRNFYAPFAATTGLPSTPDAPLTVPVTASRPPDTGIYVTAINADGEAAGSVFVSTFLPFRTRDEFIGRQYRDLVGHAPSPAELAQGQGYLNGAGPLQLFAPLLQTGRAHQAVEPVARLYRAYLLRDPDLSGLDYWVRKREAGATLGRISEQFARSGEFTRRYGALSNRAFVEQIYANVLGRPGDQTGIDFWTRQLDTGRKNRGAVMVNFSESTEYVRKNDPKVQPLAAFFLMLHRLPTAADAALTSDWRREYVANAILQSQEYDDLVP